MAEPLTGRDSMRVISSPASDKGGCSSSEQNPAGCDDRSARSTVMSWPVALGSCLPMTRKRVVLLGSSSMLEARISRPWMRPGLQARDRGSRPRAPVRTCAAPCPLLETVSLADRLGQLDVEPLAALRKRLRMRVDLRHLGQISAGRQQMMVHRQASLRRRCAAWCGPARRACG